ncbi:MAG: hypothetical protein CBD27_07025 [Rhodospirillaceae bacterium TMED167]|nr:hypothetical protein [Rhodospirillaceae bacterium]OUW27186.1 MAG: hypothetical protein CBD27_07025 [Rhodospirillaceae bacterium TMED167]
MLVDPSQDSGVPGGAELLEFSEAIIGPDRARLDAARDALKHALSPATVSGAAAIAGNFSKNDRVANGCGIPSDPMVMNITEDIRADLGLNNFRSAVNTFKHL